jgi:hypothetical protein
VYLRADLEMEVMKKCAFGADLVLTGDYYTESPCGDRGKE